MEFSIEGFVSIFEAFAEVAANDKACDARSNATEQAKRRKIPGVSTKFRIFGVVGLKVAHDFVLNKDGPSISFERLAGTRYYVYLLFALTRHALVGCSSRDAYRAWTWLPGREFFANVCINWHTPTEAILISESKRGPGILHISPRYYSEPIAGHRFFAPYFAHPAFYKAGLHNTVFEMRGRERDIRVFFAGTTSTSAYSESFSFPILSRDRILHHIIEKFGESITAKLHDNSAKPIVFITTDDTRNILEKHKLSLQDYMNAMSRSDFFICPPGWLMPHSHNLIEAMSVGTIPITNYPSYMRPPLTPEVNCLAFSTLEGLEKVIECAMRMSAREVQRLREGAISYYDENVDPKSFGEKLLQLSASISELVVNDESGR